MPLEREEKDGGLFDALFRSLQNAERRRILFDLVAHNPREPLLVPEEVRLGEKEIEQLNIELVHHHLPVLEDAGFIRWDRDAGQIHRGPRYDEVSDLLQIIKDRVPDKDG